MTDVVQKNKQFDTVPNKNVNYFNELTSGIYFATKLLKLKSFYFAILRG